MKRVLTLVAAVAAFTMVAGTALAADDSAATTDLARHPHRGALWAVGEGTGLIEVEDGWVIMRVDGDVVISGGVVDLRIDGEETREPQSDGAVDLTLDDFTGRVFVRGSDYTVEVDGRMALHGRGHGDASFDGKGWWHTRRAWGRWSGPDPISVGPTES